VAVTGPRVGHPAKPGPAARAHAATGVARTARAVAIAAFLLYALSGGGRIAGSDEVTMFELSRALLHGGIAVPEGATLAGRGVRLYTKNAAAQAIAALPLTALGEAAAAASGLAEPRRTLAVRFVVSFFNAAVTALLLGVFYAAARRLGARASPALAATLMLGFTTPLWVYSKSFMAEPLQALGLLLALAGAAGGAAGLAALGAFLAVSAKLSMLPLTLACLLPLAAAPRRALRLPLIGLARRVAPAQHQRRRQTQRHEIVLIVRRDDIGPGRRPQRGQALRETRQPVGSPGAEGQQCIRRGKAAPRVGTAVVVEQAQRAR